VGPHILDDELASRPPVAGTELQLALNLAEPGPQLLTCIENRDAEFLQHEDAAGRLRF